MNGIWNLIADMSESGVFPEIQEKLQSSGPLSHPKKELRGLCAAVQSRTEYGRKGEERERMVKSSEEKNRKRGKMRGFLQKRK